MIKNLFLYLSQTLMGYLVAQGVLVVLAVLDRHSQAVLAGLGPRAHQEDQQ